MGRLQWSYELSGVVRARPESVASWWCDPDRAKEFLFSAKGNGLIETSVSESVEDGIRVQSFQLMDAQGIEYLHRIEMDLTPNGMPGWNDRIFKVPTRETVTFHSPIGNEMTKTCVGQIGFTPIPDDSTAIRATLDVSLVGGQWLYRRKISRLTKRAQPSSSGIRSTNARKLSTPRATRRLIETQDASSGRLRPFSPEVPASGLGLAPALAPPPSPRRSVPPRPLPRPSSLVPPARSLVPRVAARCGAVRVRGASPAGVRSWPRSPEDAVSRAEDGIRTRDPHLGKVFEFVYRVQSGHASWSQSTVCPVDLRDPTLL